MRISCSAPAFALACEENSAASSVIVRLARSRGSADSSTSCGAAVVWAGIASNSGRKRCSLTLATVALRRSACLPRLRFSTSAKSLRSAEAEVLPMAPSKPSCTSRSRTRPARLRRTASCSRAFSCFLPISGSANAIKLSIRRTVVRKRWTRLGEISSARRLSVEERPARKRSLRFSRRVMGEDSKPVRLNDDRSPGNT